jgi:hypothetical protein
MSRTRAEATTARGFRLAVFSWLGLNSLYVIGRPAIDDLQVQPALQVVLVLALVPVATLGVTAMRRLRR